MFCMLTFGVSLPLGGRDGVEAWPQTCLFSCQGANTCCFCFVQVFRHFQTGHRDALHPLCKRVPGGSHGRGPLFTVSGLDPNLTSIANMPWPSFPCQHGPVAWGRHPAVLSPLGFSLVSSCVCLHEFVRSAFGWFSGLVDSYPVCWLSVHQSKCPLSF